MTIVPVYSSKDFLSLKDKLTRYAPEPDSGAMEYNFELLEP